MRNRLLIAVFAALTVTLSACGINSIPTAEENAKAKWADVQNQYQRRADLIPNLVNTVRAAATQERTVLREVTEARASATRVTVTPDQLTDPAAVARYAAAQSQLTAVAAAAAGGLSGASQTNAELPDALQEPARRHREPHHGRPARLQRGGAGL